MEKALRKFADVLLIAPETEQSGVGHSITYLTPLTCKKVYADHQFRGWAVLGSPADCVKIGVLELSQEPIDLVVSGINGGLNAGINVLYSGTVAAAVEGAFFGIPSIAVSTQFEPDADFESAAEIASQIVQQIYQHRDSDSNLFNVNIPAAAVHQFADNAMPTVDVVSMGVDRYNDRYIRRQDPKGRDYYWSAGDPSPQETKPGTDVHSIAQGNVCVSPLHFDLTTPEALPRMAQWNLSLTAVS
jgi:5'-nucleotidase